MANHHDELGEVQSGIIKAIETECGPEMAELSEYNRSEAY